MYECQGSGNPAFTCESKHNSDRSTSLEIFGQWLIDTARSGDETEKKSFCHGYLLVSVNSST